MDFPVFHLDLLNNRVYVAVVAILHVLVNHGMAVGGIPVVVYLERKALRTGDERWRDLARRTMTFFFIITTTVGALSGVGIWLAVTLVNPAAIGSLLRVFFWTWTIEWVVFVSEVVLILAYQLSWQRMSAARHVRFGTALAAASWITMVLIVAILAFMMDPGAWQTKRTLLAGMFNPLYLPQLAFRTGLAMLLGGAYALPLAFVFTRRDTGFRQNVVRSLGGWMLAWGPLCLGGAWWYAHRVPPAFMRSLPVAMLTQGLAAWSETALRVAGGCLGVIALAALVAWRAPRRVPAWAALVPAVLLVWLTGHFERVREFLRKPYAIANVLYANGLRQDDYPLFERDGLLAHATYLTGAGSVGSPGDEREVGRQVFLLACSRCHTVDGVNGLREILSGMYGPAAPWRPDAISAYVEGMHRVRSFMPPFPGSESERRALAIFLAGLREEANPRLEGAQASGIRRAPAPVTVVAAGK